MVVKKLEAIIILSLMVLTSFYLVTPVQAGNLLIEKNQAANDGYVTLSAVNDGMAMDFTTLPTQTSVDAVYLYLTAGTLTHFYLGLSATATQTISSWKYYNTMSGSGGGNGWYGAIATSPIPVLPSTHYYIIMLRMAGSGSMTIPYDTENYYTGGRVWTHAAGGAWNSLPLNVDSNFRVYGFLNVAPSISISSGTHTGYLNTAYSYTINAQDGNVDEQLQYCINWHDGYGAWTDFTNEYNEGGYTKAYKTVSHTWTSDFNGNILVKVRDSLLVEGSVYSYAMNAYNHAPVLSNGYVSPSAGDQSTPFYFYVKYTDGDDQMPGNKVCYWTMPGVGESNQQMSVYSGSDPQSGITYSLGPKTASNDGIAYYHFVFDDGTNTVRLPTSGEYSFIVSTNHAPNTISAGDILTSPLSFYRGQLVHFYAHTTDPDGNLIKYGFDWDLDSTVDTWSTFYPSGTECDITHTYGYNDFDGVGGETLPAYVKVKAADLLETGFTLGVINLLNHAPNATTIYGSASVQNTTSNTWNLTQVDWETDQMRVTFSWGDGTATTVTGWNISGFNTSASHTYTSKGSKTITCTITDEFGGIVTTYKSVTVEDVPNCPDNIQSTSGSARLHITWNSPSEDGGKPILTYGIKWWRHSLGEGTATFVYEIPYTNATDEGGAGHNITGLTNAVQYDFKMSCNNTYGQSAWSSVYVNTPGHTSPSAPIIISLAQYSGTAVDIGWKASDFYDGAVISAYYVVNSTDGITYYALGSTTTRTYHITSLTNGLTYYFKVYSVDNQSGTSLYSNVVFTTIDDVSPTEPILTVLSTNTYSLSVNVSWSASTDSTAGINYYTLQESDSTSFDDPINTYEGNTLFHTFTSNHGYGETYYYRVRAVDIAGNPSNWNGPVQTTLETNASTSEEYSKVLEIWFHANTIVINDPVYVTVSVEKTYAVYDGNVMFTVDSTDTIMRLSDTTAASTQFSGTWTSASSGDVAFLITVTNENGAVTTVTVPVTVVNTNGTVKPNVKVFESGGDVVVVTFSEDTMSVSSYKDTLGAYHVNFGAEPSGESILDLTSLEPAFVQGYIWFIKVNLLNSQQLRCYVHGNTHLVDYKIEPGYTIKGYNDWKTKYLGWILGKDFVLIQETTDYVLISSTRGQLIAKV